jgi:hypothetical protein
MDKPISQNPSYFSGNRLASVQAQPIPVKSSPVIPVVKMISYIRIGKKK